MLCGWQRGVVIEECAVDVLAVGVMTRAVAGVRENVDGVGRATALARVDMIQAARGVERGDAAALCDLARACDLANEGGGGRRGERLAVGTARDALHHSGVKPRAGLGREDCVFGLWGFHRLLL